jgi:hypothetical protein
MVRDEAPAATIGGFNGIGNVTARKSAQVANTGTISKERSDQPRCCGNPSWTGPAGIGDGWLHCNIQVACHPAVDKLSN